jgi:Dolichyl-phosphate-mannose-protein mannosyltransferase
MIAASPGQQVLRIARNLMVIPTSCQTSYSRSVRELVRRSPRWFGGISLAGLGLRLLFFFAAPQVTDDSRIYADIARNWLQHGIYGITTSAGIVPTYIRLPGYPGFLAAIFAIFGENRFRAVMCCQIILDLGTCFLIADLARRSADERAAKMALALAMFCPFLANYSAAVLTENLEVFFTALALNLAVIGLEDLSERRFRAWIASGLSIAACIYLRPDGGLLLPAIGLYLLWTLMRRLVRGDAARNASNGSLIWAGLLLALFSLGPLAPWAIRNLHTMHTLQPLTPRYANEPGEFVPAGFNRWVKTWIADYTSVEEIYWQEPGAKIDPNLLPARAFDSREQKARTREILDQYNENFEIDSVLDSEFESLAEQRIHGHYLRYYGWLPGLRIADMWLRPRTELLPADSRWWEFNEDAKWIAVTIAFAVINLAYVVLGAMGWWRGRRLPGLGLLVLFVLIRSLFLGTLENPEPRYTLECYPAVIVLAAIINMELDSRSRFQN